MSTYSLFCFSVLILLMIFMNFHNQMSKLKSFIWSYIIPITTQMKWAGEFLFQNSFFYHRIDNKVPELCQNLMIVQHKSITSTSEVVECAVCLNTIEEGEEVRELRCDHLFHRVCLDRWARYKHVTCPLCRVPLLPSAPRPIMDMEFETQLLVFEKFTSFTSTERDTWWLR